MGLSAKPRRLLSRFNAVAKNVLGAAAVGLMLLGGTAAYADPAPETDENSVNYEFLGDRTIRLVGAINTETSIGVINALLELSRKDPKADIELRINSGGGGVNDGLAIYDVMKSLPNDIRTVCEGNAQSMAAVLLSAGTQGKRFSYPNCVIMYHQPGMGAKGQITDMDIAAAQGNKAKDRLVEVMRKSTGWPEDILKDLMERNLYPTAEEAVELGFIDRIIEEQNPDPAPPPRTQLPDSFCEKPGREHIQACRP